MGFTDDIGAGLGYLSGAGPLATAGGYLVQHAGDIGGDLKDAGLLGASTSSQNKMANQNAVGAAGMGLAGYGQGQMQQLGARGDQSLDALEKTANGANSVSAEQLRQGLQQNQAAQQSMAAGAAPQNQAMAARTAAIQSGRLGAGLAGQQAVAGLAERNQAQQQYAGLLGTLRGQDAQAAIGGLGAANQAYGSGLNGTPDPTIAQQWAPVVQALGPAISDRRLKTDIAKVDDADARKTLDGLQGFSYNYRDERHGKGRQLGVMAQDLQHAGLGHAVLDTPIGKMVNGSKLALGLAGLVGSLNKRVNEIEAESKPGLGLSGAKRR